MLLRARHVAFIICVQSEWRKWPFADLRFRVESSFHVRKGERTFENMLPPNSKGIRIVRDYYAVYLFRELH